MTAGKLPNSVGPREDGREFHQFQSGGVSDCPNRRGPYNYAAMAKTVVPSKTMTNSTPTHDEIAAHAYQIYLREGCVEGRDLEHWLKAEAELRAGAPNGHG